MAELVLPAVIININTENENEHVKEERENENKQSASSEKKDVDGDADEESEKGTHNASQVGEKKIKGKGNEPGKRLKIKTVSHGMQNQDSGPNIINQYGQEILQKKETDLNAAYKHVDTVSKEMIRCDRCGRWEHIK